jgi:hypothetical protein
MSGISPRNGTRTPKKRPPEEPGGPAPGMAVPLHQALGRIVLVLLHLALVPDHLAVQLVDKFINGGVQILVRTLRKEIATLDMDVAFGALSFFLFFLLLHGKQHFDINDLVKMPGDPIKRE